VVFFLNIFKPREKLILVSGGIWLAAVLIFWNLVPLAAQKFLVKPNELAKETPYIAYNIDYTRKAYGLDKIKEVDFQGREELRPEDLKHYDTTIQNIRIWDERPLLQTYRQIQSIRLYYDFNNVDVDRYLIDKQYRQIMLAARELVVNQLPPQAQTWVNRRLIYTHGYGIAASPVNEVTSEGLPHLLIKDLPPSFTSDLTIDRPEIYYGEKTDEYVLVKTKIEEFDYPKGDKNVYTIYQGRGGVPIKSFLRRAYTTSNMYPYSRRSYKRFKNKTLNYIRNSVKVIIDAYNGDVSFYIVDEKDPIVTTYARIFPDLFKPFNEMPADLKKHIRYPKDLFKIQVDTYKTYHMDNVQVFYNQEDLWGIPDELYGDSRQEMEPYYIILKLPEEDKEEFLLMLPFTPSKKDNMISWLAARSDLPHYGNLLVYKLPKEKLFYGPMQIEARVDQQTDISRELSLWGQRGSRVIRGNLLAIPIGGTFIYVEPVYLEAKQEAAAQPPEPQAQPGIFGKSKGQGAQTSVADKSRSAALPELKRVIVALGNRITMEENLDKALKRVLEKVALSKGVVTSPEALTVDTGNMGQMALQHNQKAKAALRQGNWAEYGKALEELEKILIKMSRTAE